jgi:peptidyl-prolyl cis-trans isomerase SDCCAG10
MPKNKRICRPLTIQTPFLFFFIYIFTPLPTSLPFPYSTQVVLRTTIGDLDIELWSKEAPTAVRNFVQLCFEGYYDGTPFHRIIKDFMVQGGDPTGTGNGGESIYGRPFKDEFHSRIKFNHRGLVACANQNAPNTNGAQFFITLDRADHLDRKATVFGKITGDTVYNLMRFNELEVGDDDRPVDPPVLLRADVLLNPFEDIKPRVSRESKEAAKASEAKQKESEKKNARKGAKNFKLISFGDEAEEEEEAEAKAAVKMKIKSAHDALEDAKLSKEAAVEVDLAKVREAMKAAAAKGASEETLKNGDGKGDNGKDWAAKMREKVASKTKLSHAKLRQEEEEGGGGGALKRAVIVDQEDKDDDDDVVRQEPFSKRVRLEGTGPGTKSKAAIVAPSRQILDKDLLTTWEQKRQTYKERKRLVGHREKATMSKLATFMQKISSKHDSRGEPSLKLEKKEEKQGDLEESLDQNGAKGYDGKIDKDVDHRSYMPAAWRLDTYLEGGPSTAGAGTEDGGEAADERDDFSLEMLRNHKLQFGGKKEKDPHARRDDVDDYVVVDPLLEAGKAKFNKQQQKEKKRTREWAGRSRD